MTVINQEPGKNKFPVVNSHNEWDPLEEVIVGIANNICIPKWDIMTQAVTPPEHAEYFKQKGGEFFPQEVIDAANRDLDGLAERLISLGITVQRPDPIDWSRNCSTPDFGPVPGWHSAMPRDSIITIGNEIIEATMAIRGRYFETIAYRSLMLNYFRQGAKWTMAPRPRMSDELYNYNFKGDKFNFEPGDYAITEYEPVFDAAEFARCGRDLFTQISQVTNRSGITWLQRHIGDEYRIHILQFNDPHAMHIDTSFVPLAPGKLMLNPTRILTIPEMFEGWEILMPPPSALPKSHKLYYSSPWISMNVLSLDEKTVVIADHEEPTIAYLESKGFDVVAVPFKEANRLGGSIHCATCDIRRSGTLKSYF